MAHETRVRTRPQARRATILRSQDSGETREEQRVRGAAEKKRKKEAEKRNKAMIERVKNRLKKKATRGRSGGGGGGGGFGGPLEFDKATGRFRRAKLLK